MKLRNKTIALTTSLAIIFTYFVIGLYASNAYSNCIDSSMSKYKVQKKSNNQQKNKIASVESPDIYEEDMKLEDWMFNCCFYSCFDCDRNEIESWMLDRAFWKILKPFDLNEEVFEEESEIEEWMIKFCPIKCSNSGIYTNYLEKEWAEKHFFLIL